MSPSHLHSTISLHKFMTTLQFISWFFWFITIILFATVIGSSAVFLAVDFCCVITKCCMQKTFCLLVLWGTLLVMWCRPDGRFTVKYPANCHLLFSFSLYILQIFTLDWIPVLQIKHWYSIIQDFFSLLQ